MDGNTIFDAWAQKRAKQQNVERKKLQNHKLRDEHSAKCCITTAAPPVLFQGCGGVGDFLQAFN